MEKRIINVNISSAGGTATKGSKTYKITLPTSWMHTLDVSEENRKLELTFDGAQISLSRCLDLEKFVESKLERGHDVHKIKFFDGDELCTTIYADFNDELISVENHANNPIKTAFGNKSLPTWADFLAFLEDRCVPRERSGLREYLEVIGVGEYDPIEIIKKTAGRMAEDDQWLVMEIL